MAVGFPFIPVITGCSDDMAQIVECDIKQQDRESGSVQRCRIEVSPFTLIRVAGVPYRLVAATAQARTWELLQKALAAERTLAASDAAVVEELHGCVPGIADNGLRRAVLALKRCAHGHRFIETGRDAETVRAALPQWPALRRLPDWLDAQMARLHALDEARAGFLQELDATARAALRDALRLPSFANGVALNAPRLYEKLVTQQDWNSGKRSNKSERSLLNYLTRAATKTSPMSTFMYTAWVPTDPAAPSSRIGAGAAYARITETHLNLGTLARLARLAMRQAQLVADPLLAPNVSVTAADGGVRAIAGSHIEMLGRAWRQERVARFTLPAGIAALLLAFDSARPLSALLHDFGELGYAEPEARRWIRQLTERGLICLAMPWTSRSACPVHSLLDSLYREPGQQAHRLAELVARMQALAEAIDERALSAGSALDTAGLYSELNGLTDAAQREVGAPFAAPFQSNITQNAVLTGVQGGFGAAFATLAEELGDMVSEHVTLSHDYQVLLAIFIDRYGVDGECANLLGFLMDHFHTFEERRVLPLAQSFKVRNAVIGVTAYVQLLADSLAQLDAGAAGLVVNLVYERGGWQSARYLSSGDPAPAASMADWLRTLAGDAEPVEILLSSDCNALQAHAAVTERALAWPGEGAERLGAAVALDPRRIALRHDSASNRLRCYDPDGREISLMYLGGAMPLPGWGISHMLVKLTEPLSFARPYHLYTAPPDGDVQVHERIASGRVVLYRAAWKVRAALLSSRLMDGTAFEQMERVVRFFDCHGIPRVCFVNAIVKAYGVEAQMVNADRLRKPTWLDIANSVCLDLLRRLCGACEWVTFHEALPGEGQVWLELDGERHVSELQLELKLTLDER
jgi:hypothetical protein